MAASWTPAWVADWRRLTAAQRDALECRYDSEIPHEAILCALAEALNAQLQYIDES